jgi:hypothetical protein
MWEKWWDQNKTPETERTETDKEYDTGSVYLIHHQPSAQGAPTGTSDETLLYSQNSGLPFSFKDTIFCPR